VRGAGQGAFWNWVRGRSEPPACTGGQRVCSGPGFDQRGRGIWNSTKVTGALSHRGRLAGQQRSVQTEGGPAMGTNRAHQIAVVVRTDRRGGGDHGWGTCTFFKSVGRILRNAAQGEPGQQNNGLGLDAARPGRGTRRPVNARPTTAHSRRDPCGIACPLARG